MDANTHKFELLKMARELLNEEYINRRAEDHNRWVAESDTAWKTRRIKLPYPPFAPYPTETEIVAKAASLYSFLNTAEPAADAAKLEVGPAAPVKAEAPVVPTAMSNNVELVMEISKSSLLDVQLPTVETVPVTDLIKAEEPVAKTAVELVAEPIVVLDTLVTTVATKTKVEEMPTVETPEVKPTTPEPKPLFAVQSWLQKIQK
jgi:hypothetical protein